MVVLAASLYSYVAVAQDMALGFSPAAILMVIAPMLIFAIATW